MAQSEKRRRKEVGVELEEYQLPAVVGEVWWAGRSKEKRREQILPQVSQRRRRGSANQREAGCDVRVVKVRRWRTGRTVVTPEQEEKSSTVAVLKSEAASHSCWSRARAPPSSSRCLSWQTHIQLCRSSAAFSPEQLCELKAAGTGRLLFPAILE